MIEVVIRQVNLVQQQAWDIFGHLPRGYSQVRAVRDWVHVERSLSGRCIQPQHFVMDTLRDGVGICRDLLTP